MSKVLGESVWLFGSYGLSRLGRIAMMFAVAAFLSPREYGLIGLSAVVIVIAQIILGCIWPAVVHRRDLNERYLNTAFTANILAGFIVTICLFLTAPGIARFFGDTELTALLRVMAVALIADGIFYVPDGLLRKELSFKSRALPEIAGTFGAGITTIGLLLLGVGVLSFAVGFVVEIVIRCVLTVRKLTRRPKLQVSWLSLREIVSYSKHILGADLARGISSNLDYIVVGRVLGTGPLGLYTLAFNLANYPVLHFADLLSRIIFPTFATLHEDIDYARRVFLKTIQLVAALVTPLLVVLALLASPLLVGVLGEEWQPAVLPLQVMAIAGIFRAMSRTGADMYRAMGLPSIPFKVNLLEGLLVAGGLLLFVSRGIEAVALTVGVILSLTSSAIMLASCRTFGISIWELAQALVPGIALAASAAVTILSLELLDLNLLPDALQLVMLIVAAGAAMVICLATVLKSFMHEMIRFVSRES